MVDTKICQRLFQRYYVVIMLLLCCYMSFRRQYLLKPTSTKHFSMGPSVSIRQILTYKDETRTERIIMFIMTVDSYLPLCKVADNPFIFKGTVCLIKLKTIQTWRRISRCESLQLS